MVTRGAQTVTGMVTVVAVAVVAAALVGTAEGINRGPAARENRMKNLKSSNVDLKALKEKYAERVRSPCLTFEPSPEDPPLPSVPLSFMTQVEFTFLDYNIQRVIHGVEMYDNPSKRGVNDYDLSAGVVLTRPYLLREELHYDHLMDEALFITTEDPCIVTGEEGCNAYKYCAAGKIKDLSAELLELFGIVDTVNGEEFMGAMGIMQFGPQFNYTYVDTDECRGARCVVFNACVDKPDEGTSLMYNYYWTEKGWDVQNDGEQVPMMVDIVGPDITMHIEFFDYRRDWMPALDELEPPVDVYCHNRINHISSPKPVTRFYYRSEQVTGLDIPLPIGENQTEMVQFHVIYPQQEWYDYEKRVSRMDYTPLYFLTAERRFENLTQDISDYNTGLHYKVHPRLSSCKIKNMDYNITWGDVVVESDGSIHMMSPWDYEDLLDNMQYNGVHWERGMEADVWVGQKLSPTLGMNETIVWYFASPFYGAFLGMAGETPRAIELPTVDKVPIKMEKYLNVAEGFPHFVYHIYAYEGVVPLTHNHDVSSCFNHEQMRHFTFDLPQDAVEQSDYLRENLLYAIQWSLQTAGNVSPLRINRLELNETETAVKVLFTILEKASLVANVTGDENESTMDVAAKAIKAKIDDSQLTIVVKKGNSVDTLRKEDDTIVTLTARPNTMVEMERNNDEPQRNEEVTGFSPGAMAGLGVGMAILGLLLGLGGMYLCRKNT